MDYTDVIIELYNRVYELQKSKFNVHKDNIRTAIMILKEVYLPNPHWRHDTVSKTADFNDPAHRCAYLHKYAMVHTGLLCNILQSVFQQPGIQRDLISKSRLNICSLGGGPGTEVVSLLFVLWEVFESKQCSVSIIDFFVEWERVFESIVKELKTGRYGDVDSMLSFGSFNYQYLNGDLLTMSPFTAYKVLQAVKDADIITMVKFVSAAACEKTRAMIKKIFNTMKLGAMLLFVDNAAGGFDRMIRETAFECGMQSVYGPLKHYEYENEAFSLQRYGYTSQSKTKVYIEVLKKTSLASYNPTAYNQTAYNPTAYNPTAYNPTAYNPTVSANSLHATQQLQREYIHGPRRRVQAPFAQNIRLGRQERSEGCCSII